MMHGNSSGSCVNKMCGLVVCLVNDGRSKVVRVMKSGRVVAYLVDDDGFDVQ